MELTETAQSFQVCREWESTALKVNGDVRLARIRIGVVLGKDGGALGINKLTKAHLPLILILTSKYYCIL